MDIITNVPTEVLFVGCIYKQPDLLVNYGQYIRSKYDFSDEVTRFFYDSAEIIYKTRTQTFIFQKSLKDFLCTKNMVVGKLLTVG